MKIEVISSGPLSTIQDLGRFGYMDSGFSPGGAMDDRSLRLANILVGNEQGDPCVEMTMIGAKLRFDCPCVIALTGADMNPMKGDDEVPMYKAVQMKKGDVLSLSAAKRGMRCYLSAAGSFNIPKAMGSWSTNLKIGIGGLDGRKLNAGDELPLRMESDLFLTGRRSFKNEEKYPSKIYVRVVLGPQYDFFTEKGIETFLNSQYVVTDKSDRMGIRLDGEKIEAKGKVDILSDGIATGAVQIPASGTPIIMMADRQTTGGYAKIANVIKADLPKMAQAKPGTKVCFEEVSFDEATKLFKTYENEINLFEYSMMFER